MLSVKSMHAQKLALCGTSMLFAVAACNSRNVVHGDRDYPDRNVAPARFLVLHGTMDPSLDVRFQSSWQVDNHRCGFISNWNAGAYETYTYSMPITIVRDGEKFSARLPIDG